ncbi:MAG: SAM-dependent methyltransferase [Candidatus Riflemargulisbacteria bacterium]
MYKIIAQNLPKFPSAVMIQPSSETTSNLSSIDDSTFLLESFVPQKDSIMLGRLNEWFYRFYATKAFDQVFDTSASRGAPIVRLEAERFVRQLEQMDQHHKLPNEIIVYEIGCGNGRFASDYLASIEELRPDFYKKIRYSFCDFSLTILEEIKQSERMRTHLNNVEFIHMDATKPLPFKKQALLIRCNELLDDLDQMQIIYKQGKDFYQAMVETRINPKAHFVTKNGEALPTKLVSSWLKTNSTQLSELDPSFVEQINIKLQRIKIANINNYPYGKLIQASYANIANAEIPLNIGAFDFTARVVQHLVPDYGQLVIYDYGIYSDSLEDENSIRTYGGQPTLNVNFFLLEKLIANLQKEYFCEVKKKSDIPLPNGLENVLTTNRSFYRLQVIAPPQL